VENPQDVVEDDCWDSVGCGAQIFRPVPRAASPLIGAPLGNATAQVGVCPDAKPAVGLLTIAICNPRVGRQACWRLL
jgi:hypothetical protein